MKWGMYDVRVAAKVRMIPIPILYCYRGRECRQ